MYFNAMSIICGCRSPDTRGDLPHYWLIFGATEAANAPVNPGSASPPLLLGAHRRFASGFYASAASTPTLAPASRTLSPGLFTPETCRPDPRSFSPPPVPLKASSLLVFPWASAASFAFSSAIVNAPDAPSLQRTATVRRWRRREPAGSTLLRYKHWQPPCWEASTR